MGKTYIINNFDDWQKLAEDIVPKFNHKILLLKGNLGAGKTTFTKYILEKMGSTDPVSSPTYAIVNEYHVANGNVYHFDLYRLKNMDDVFDIGIDDYLDSAVFTIIEWPEVFENHLSEPYHILQIENKGDFREVIFS